MAKTKETSIVKAESNPWDRLPKEPLKAYEAWKVFRDWPPMDRSIFNVGKRLGVGRQIYDWAKKYSWEDRTIAWEAELEREDRQRRIDALDRMTVKHTKIVNGILKLAVKRLASMKPEEMDPQTTLKFLLEAMNLERKITGIPDIISEARVQNETSIKQDVAVNLAFDISPNIIEAVQQAIAAGASEQEIIDVDPAGAIIEGDFDELPGTVDPKDNG